MWVVIKCKDLLGFVKIYEIYCDSESVFEIYRMICPSIDIAEARQQENKIKTYVV